jgi:hypothetical protein
MLLNVLFLFQLALSEEVQVSTQTPIWVPFTILTLILLLFIWGMTRGNVKDENYPDFDEGENH